MHIIPVFHQRSLNVSQDTSFSVVAPPSSVAPSSPGQSSAPLILSSPVLAPISTSASVSFTDNPAGSPAVADAALLGALDRINRGREEAVAYCDHRLNRAVLLPHLCEAIQLCRFTSKSELVCYCLRISNVDVGTSDPATALNTILDLGDDENWGEIVMISIHLEVDDSWSVDLGFRFVEDALVMWSRHGKRVRGRYWNIVPIQAVLGICFVARKFVSTRSSAYAN